MTNFSSKLGAQVPFSAYLREDPSESNSYASSIDDGDVFSQANSIMDVLAFVGEIRRMLQKGS
ncbi:MAG: hypothetical protein QXO24_03440 [Candidatus Micrarchaeaceae archaeon]